MTKEDVWELPYHSAVRRGLVDIIELLEKLVSERR